MSYAQLSGALGRVPGQWWVATCVLFLGGSAQAQQFEGQVPAPTAAACNDAIQVLTRGSPGSANAQLSALSTAVRCGDPGISAVATAWLLRRRDNYSETLNTFFHATSPDSALFRTAMQLAGDAGA